MSILEALRADQRRSGSQCKTCEFLEKQPPDERAEWQQAFADKSFTTSSIHRLMAAKGFTGGDTSPAKHRAQGHA